MTVRVEGEGFERIDVDHLIGEPLTDFLNRVTIAGQSLAREEAPVDTGRLANSINAEVDRASIPGWGQFGPNVDYARAVHDGSRPHWPPIAPLIRWGQRHGVNPYALQRAIARRGTKPNPFLDRAWKRLQPLVPGFLGQLGRDIADRWRGGR